MRVIIFANGELRDFENARRAIQSGDFIIAADGGARRCLEMGIMPAQVIGDLDSLAEADLATVEAAGAEVIRHPARKDFTDLELALQHAAGLGAEEIVIFGALGARWDQTIANILLPAIPIFAGLNIRLLDGSQEMCWLRSGETRILRGHHGDTVSLIPLGGNAHGVATHGMEYTLQDETLYFGSTRGVSNVMLGEEARLTLGEGLLLCVTIHL